MADSTHVNVSQISQDGLKVHSITPTAVARVSSKYNEIAFSQDISGLFAFGADESDNRYRNVAIIEFSTGHFNGLSDSIVFSFIFVRNSTSTYYYALCTSYENISSYLNTTELIAENNQICNGSFQTRNTNDIVVYTNNIKPNTTYYLILWGSSSYDYQNAIFNDKTVNLYYKEIRPIYIDNSLSYDKYQCHIDNGTTWALYAPYIDNGTTWEPL